MSPFKIPEPPYDIEGIMENLRNQFEGDGGNAPSSAPAPMPRVNSADSAKQDQALMDWLERSRPVAPAYRIRSHRALMRYFIDPIKKFLHWGTRPYVNLLIEKQEAFNQASTESHRAALGRLRSIETTLAALDKSLRSVAETLGEFSRHQQSMNAHLQGQIDRSAVLQDKRHAAQDEINRTLAKETLREHYDLGPFFESIPESKRLEMLDETRGSFREIWSRHHAYLEYFRNRPGQILDVGCGRGEFLKMMLEEGIEAWGCEIDPLMISICAQHGVLAKPMDALEAIQSVPDASLGGVFASQVIEHMFPGDLLSFIAIARKKIAPGGVIVLETVNPQSLAVLSKSYYKDIDHKRAVDPDYLALLLDAAGFVNVRPGRTMPFGEKERLPSLPDPAECGLTAEAHRVLQTAIDKLNAAIWAEQDFHVFAEVPPLENARREGSSEKFGAQAR